MRLHKHVLGGLVAVGLAAGGAAWYCVWRDQASTHTEAAAAVQLDTLIERAARFNASLGAYGAPGIADALWYTQSAGLLKELHAKASALDSTLRGVAMMPRARLAEALQGVTEAVGKARVNHDSGRTLMALDVLEGDGRPAADAVSAALGTIREATRAELAAVHGTWRLRAAGALAGWAVTWFLGLVWLVRRSASQADVPSVPAPAPASADTTEAVAPPVAAALVPSTTERRDLGSVAEACEAISHVENAEELPRALARATDAIGATGVALWTRDGDALVLLCSHGYPDGLSQRLGRIALDDQNLLTSAWHGRQPRTASAPPGHKAALVSPILGVTGTIGVLAAEVPPGTESDPQVVASARLIAAQLSTVLGEPRALPHDQGSTPNGESEGDPPATLPLEAAG